MASETGDPIDWPLPPTLHRAVPPELHVLHGVNSGYKSKDLLLQPRPLGMKAQRGPLGMSLGMKAQRTACAATNGVICCRK